MRRTKALGPATASERLHLCDKQITDKMLHTFEGLIRGIALDESINADEVATLTQWIDANPELRYEKTFSKFISAFESSTRDGVLDRDEAHHLLKLSQELRAESLYYDITTGAMQVLQGMLSGVISDGVINAEERRGLFIWLDSNPNLKGYFPFDEIASVLIGSGLNGDIPKDVHDVLVSYFQGFASPQAANQNGTLANPLWRTGICCLEPRISFDLSVFCLTGTFKMPREEVEEIILQRGGDLRDRVSKTVDYLVVGSGADPRWAYGCYGRKVEQAMNLRRVGHRIAIVHEADFWERLTMD
jgi:hypothetical protein